jgi:hypothetical protein
MVRQKKMVIALKQDEEAEKLFEMISRRIMAMT